MGCNHLITFLRPGISWPSVAATPAGAEMGVCDQLGIRRPAFTIGAGPPFTHNLANVAKYKVCSKFYVVFTPGFASDNQVKRTEAGRKNSGLA